MRSCWHKRLLLNGPRRLDHCDVIASLAPRGGQSWHSKPNVIHGSSLGPNTSCVLHMDWKHGYVPYLIPSTWQCSIDFQQQNGRDATFSESYVAQISVKISRLCGLLVCCSSSTLGSRANDYVKTLATLGFWRNHSPCSLGCWTNNTYSQPAHYPLSKTQCIDIFMNCCWPFASLYDIFDWHYNSWSQLPKQPSAHNTPRQFGKSHPRRVSPIFREFICPKVL